MQKLATLYAATEGTCLILTGIYRASLIKGRMIDFSVVVTNLQVGHIQIER